MPKFSEYRRSGKVWHSPPFYYRGGYKMCLKEYMPIEWGRELGLMSPSHLLYLKESVTVYNTDQGWRAAVANFT